MIAKTLSDELNIKNWQSNTVIKLIDEGNSIPFIARYRKEATGSLDDETLRNFNERLEYLRNLESKKEQIMGTIEEQEKLTEELINEINNAKTLVELDDIYRPFRPKRRTRATIAKEKGLEPLADLILKQEIDTPVEKIAKNYLSDELDVKNVDDAINGAKDIIAEIISDNAKYRSLIRQVSFEDGKLEISAKDKNVESEYEMYYDYNEPLDKIANHRILAINRGEKEKILKVKIETPEKDIFDYLKRHVLINKNDIITQPVYNPYTEEILEESILDSYKRLIASAIERELRNQLIERAEESSIKVFSKNLEQLLMQSPIVGKVVLGWDPGFRTGCKLAVVDETGKVLDTDIVFPTEPQNKIFETKKTIKSLVEKYNIDLIALGNGTASRESESVITEIIKELNSNLQYVIVSEAGASVYSASKLASEEFPNYDVGERSAISIARRLQDPLAELVKIDPKSIGVGQYQHDMNQKKLSDSLDYVVDKSVNNVGVDLNTASVSLLKHVSGISKSVAKNIVKYREENGIFKNRKELLKVPGLGPKAFEQCAGFMKVSNSDNPLDNTTVHPESYKATINLLNKLGYSLEDIGSDINLNNLDFETLSQQLNIGEITLRDIVKELQKPGRDPREEMPKPILREDILELENLEEGMILKGTVRNIVDFGAFVDIGVHQDGLVHISQLVENKFVKHPLDVVSVGDVVDVRVLNVDLDKKRIQLSMIL
jgi:uncharacterized protein